MLIDDNQVFQRDPIMDMIASINSNQVNTTRLRQGVYQIGHFNLGSMLSGYEQYPDIEVGPYGVCDSIENLLEKCPELQSSERYFLVSMTSIKKSSQSSEGGWRWHKWGEYIGKHKPQCEYLYDEKGIEEVFVFHIFEKQ